jgi:hypothetical protein
MRLALTLDESVVLPAKHERRRSVISSVQLAQYQRSWDNPSGSWFLVIGSDADEDMAVTAALGLMLRSTIRYAENPAAYDRPFYWPLYGGNWDRLRDREEFRSGVNGIGMLVLTNLAENSSREKIERARDLLCMYSDVPRVLTVAGTDPLLFAIDQLHMTPSRVLYLGRRRRVQQI